MDERAWVPAEIPLDRASPARIYDFMLGGYHNFQVDRDLSDAVEKIFPEVRLAAQVNRAFLRRAVTFLVQEGIDQFLDLGSGIPTVGNVHEVAQGLNPNARVVYVDIDPVAVAHSLAMLTGNPYATAIQADVRQVDTVLAHPEVQRVLDLARPVGVLMVAMLHYIVDDNQAEAAVRTLRAATVPGSYLVISHPTPREYTAEVAAIVSEIVKRGTQTRDRTPEQILGFFDDWTLVPPGIVLTPLWKPDGLTDLCLDTPNVAWTVSCVGQKAR